MTLKAPIRIACYLAACLALLPTAQAEDAKSVFDSLFSAKIKAVSATADRADDAALAKELVALAKTSANQPALLTLLCDAAHDLGTKHADGYAAAVEAMTLLADTVEDKRPAARQKLITLLTKQSAAGKPDERESAGEALIDLLITLGDEKVEKKQYEEATTDYRRAVSVATQKKSASLEDAKAKLEFVQSRDRTMKNLARLQEKLLKDANDYATAEEIVKLYVVELDDPEAAKPYLNRVKDEQLKTLVPLAAGAADAVADADALRLGEWYLALSRSVSKPSSTVLDRAESYLKRFLSRQTDEGLAQTKAKALLADVAAAQAKLTPSDFTTAGTSPPDYLRDAVLIYSFEPSSIQQTGDKMIIRDRSGLGNDGEMENVKMVKGIAGSAVAFDSAESVIRSKNPVGVVGDSTRSVAFWLKVPKERLKDHLHLFAWGGNVLNGQFGLDIHEGHFYMWGYGEKYDWPRIMAASADWQHFIITYDGRTVRWFVNGEPLVKTRDQKYGTKDSYLTIGRGPLGLMDEFAIFKRSFTRDEARKLFQASKQGLGKHSDK